MRYIKLANLYRKKDDEGYPHLIGWMRTDDGDKLVTVRLNTKKIRDDEPDAHLFLIEDPPGDLVIPKWISD